MVRFLSLSRMDLFAEGVMEERRDRPGRLLGLYLTCSSASRSCFLSRCEVDLLELCPSSDQMYQHANRYR